MERAVLRDGGGIPATLILRGGAVDGEALLGVGIVEVAELVLFGGAAERAELFDCRVVGEAALILLGEVAGTAALQDFGHVVDADLVLLGGVVGGQDKGRGNQHGGYEGGELKHIYLSMDV